MKNFLILLLIVLIVVTGVITVNQWTFSGVFEGFTGVIDKLQNVSNAFGDVIGLNGNKLLLFTVNGGYVDPPSDFIGPVQQGGATLIYVGNQKINSLGDGNFTSGSLYSTFNFHKSIKKVTYTGNGYQKGVLTIVFTDNSISVFQCEYRYVKDDFVEQFNANSGISLIRYDFN